MIKEALLHHASFSGNVEILDFVYRLAKIQLTAEQVNKLLLAEDNNRQTAWHMAARQENLEVLGKL
jgi:ankyrin repeat protein